jgi:hypothetical protein
VIQKSELKLNYLLPKSDLVTSVIQMRQAILQNQSENEVYPSDLRNLRDTRNLMMSNIPEQASFKEDEEDNEYMSGKKQRRVGRDGTSDKISDLGSVNMQSASVQQESRSQISNKVSKKPYSDVQEAHQG